MACAICLDLTCYENVSSVLGQCIVAGQAGDAWHDMMSRTGNAMLLATSHTHTQQNNASR